MIVDVECPNGAVAKAGCHARAAAWVGSLRNHEPKMQATVLRH